MYHQTSLLVLVFQVLPGSLLYLAERTRAYFPVPEGPECGVSRKRILMIQYFSFSNAKPTLSFAMSFGAIAIFTFIYLNDLNIFNQGIVNNDSSKSTLKYES